MVKTLHFPARGVALIPGPGTKILQASQLKKQQEPRELVLEQLDKSVDKMKLDPYYTPHRK